MTGLWNIIVPEATTNLITNPSFETNTTGWAAQGTNTIARSLAQQFKGAYGLLCTYQNNTVLARYNISGLTASTVYYFSARVRVVGGWANANLRLQVSNFTGVSVEYNNIWTLNTSPTEDWVYLETKVTLASDVAGDLDLTATATPNAGNQVYLDAVQFEQKSSYATTYIDGDQTGGRWSGVAHASTSSRSSQERSGGRLRNFDDYGVYVINHQGAGMPVLRNIVAQKVGQDGAIYSGTDILPRLLTFEVDIIGSSLADLHSKRKAFFDVVKPNNVKGSAPFALRYTGAQSNRVIELPNCRYDAGLESGMRNGFTDTHMLRVLCDDPAFLGLRQRGVSLSGSTTLNARGLMGYVDDVFQHFGPQATGGQVNAIFVDDNRDIYVGGSFTNWDGAGSAINNFAKWTASSSSWGKLGGVDPNGAVNAIEKDNEGRIWIGGAFSSPGGRAARWNGSSWDNMGNFNGNINTLELASNGRIWAGGAFTTENAVTMRRISYWDGAAWQEPSSGFNNAVFAMHMGDDGWIYVGGQFTTDGPGAVTNLNRIVRNTPTGGAGWNTFANGVDNNIVRTVHLAKNGLLYIGGTFTAVDGQTTDYFAFWNGSSWIPVADGPNLDVNDILELPSGDILLAGDFGALSTYNPYASFGLWDGVRFQSYLKQDPAGGGEVNAMYVIGNDIYWASNAAGNDRVPATTTVTNGGTTDAYPKLVLKFSNISGGDGFFYSVDNFTTGQHVYLNFTYAGLGSSDTIVANFDPSNPSFTSILFGDMSSRVLSGSNFSGFRLQPGDNTIGLLAYATGAASLDEAYLSFRQRFWSIDGVAD